MSSTMVKQEKAVVEAPAEVATSKVAVDPKFEKIMEQVEFAIPVGDVSTAYSRTGWNAVNRTWYSHGAGCAMAVLGKYLGGIDHDADSAKRVVSMRYGVSDNYIGNVIRGFDFGGDDVSAAEGLSGVDRTAFLNGAAIRRAVTPTRE